MGLRRLAHCVSITAAPSVHRPSLLLHLYGKLGTVEGAALSAPDLTQVS